MHCSVLVGHCVCRVQVTNLVDCLVLVGHCVCCVQVTNLVDFDLPILVLSRSLLTGRAYLLCAFVRLFLPFAGSYTCRAFNRELLHMHICEYMYCGP